MTESRDEQLTDVDVLGLCNTLDVPVVKESKEKQWDARFDWVQKEKDIGNELYRAGKFQAAIDQYLKALCGTTGFAVK